MLPNDRAPEVAVAQIITARALELSEAALDPERRWLRMWASGAEPHRFFRHLEGRPKAPARRARRNPMPANLGARSVEPIANPERQPSGAMLSVLTGAAHGVHIAASDSQSWNEIRRPANLNHLGAVLNGGLKPTGFWPILVSVEALADTIGANGRIITGVKVDRRKSNELRLAALDRQDEWLQVIVRAVRTSLQRDLARAGDKGPGPARPDTGCAQPNLEIATDLQEEEYGLEVWHL